MPFDGNAQRRITFQLIGDLLQRALRARLEHRLAGVEEDARQRDDDAALIALGRRDPRQLVLDPQLPRLGVTRGERLPRFVELRGRRLLLLLRLLRGLIRLLRLGLRLLYLLLEGLRLRFRFLALLRQLRDRTRMLLFELRARGDIRLAILAKLFELLLAPQQIGLLIGEKLRTDGSLLLRGLQVRSQAVEL